MIAKRIASSRGTSSAGRLVRYVVAAKGGIEPETWARTADYILDTRDGGEKVAGVRVTNCHASDAADATREILITQAGNTRSSNDKTYHLVFAFPDGERPTPHQLHDMEDYLVAAIGLGHHQRISAVHIDTDYLHVHVAINKVDPNTHNVIEPYYDKRALMEACDALEKQYGLTPTHHNLKRTRTPTEKQEQTRHGERTIPTAPDQRLRQFQLAAIAGLATAEPIDDLRNVPSLDVVQDLQGADLLLQVHPDEVLGDQNELSDNGLRRLRGSDELYASSHPSSRTQSGSQSGEGGDETRTPEANSEEGLTGHAGDMEAHAGRDSLIGWTRRVVAPKLRAAATWDELHRALAAHGLAIKPRGDGLVVENDAGIQIKASEVDRGFSKAGLTNRLGPFVAGPEIQRKPSNERYTAAPRQRHPNTATLFAQYQAARSVAQGRRKQDASAANRAAIVHVQKLTDWYAQRRAAIRTDTLVRGSAKTAVYASLAQEKRKDIREIKRLAAAQAKADRATALLPTWQHWLIIEAQRGNTQALDVLRSRGERASRVSTNDDWLRGNDADAARTAFLHDAKPKTDKHGAVHYTASDGTSLRDDRDGIRVAHRSDAAALLALTLAQTRYVGQALVVTGSDAFRAQLVQTAASHRLNVVFSDPAMEAARTALNRPTRTVEAPAAPSVTPLDPVAAYVAERNATADGRHTIMRHAPHTSADAGPAIYRGRRNLKGGGEAVLLERGNTMYVLSVTPNQAAKASTWRIGQTVTTDARGRFVGEARSRSR